MRSTVARLLAAVGIALLVVGYLLSAPWGAESIADADPSVVGAPIIFAAGIFATLAAAVLYELLPARDDDRTG